MTVALCRCLSQGSLDWTSYKGNQAPAEQRPDPEVREQVTDFCTQWKAQFSVDPQPCRSLSRSNHAETYVLLVSKQNSVLFGNEEDIGRQGVDSAN